MRSSSAKSEGSNLSVSLLKTIEVQAVGGKSCDQSEDCVYIESRNCNCASDASTATETTASSSSITITNDSRLGEKGASPSRITSLAYVSTTHAVNDASFDSRREALCKHYHYDIATTPDSALSSSPTQPQCSQTTSSTVHPEKEAMKRHRRDKTATFGMVGASVGTLILPVVGTVVGGVLIGYAANQSLKLYEKKIQRKWERDQFQRDASASQTARHAVFA